MPGTLIAVLPSRGLAVRRKRECGRVRALSRV